MEYHKQALASMCCQLLLQWCQQIGVVGSLGMTVAQEQTVVGLLAEVVDQGVVALLVAQKYGVITRLSECLHDALGVVEYVVVVGIGHRQQDGYALVCGIALAHVVGEDCQSVCFGQ